MSREIPWHFPQHATTKEMIKEITVPGGLIFLDVYQNTLNITWIQKSS